MPDNVDHVLNLVLGIAGRILGEPFRRQMVGRNPSLDHAVDFGLDLDESMGTGGHDRDAVPKRKARRERGPVQSETADLYHGTGMLVMDRAASKKDSA